MMQYGMPTLIENRTQEDNVPSVAALASNSSS